MQPTLCSKCKKNVAVVFISRQNEKGEMVNEGLCLKCAAQLGLPQVEEMMKKMGISPEDLENINNEMMQAFGGAEELSDMTEAQDDDGDDDEESGKTATFPFLNRLFGSSNPPAEKSDAPSGREETPKGRKADKSTSIWTATASISASGPGTASWTRSSAGRRRYSVWCRF